MSACRRCGQRLDVGGCCTHCQPGSMSAGAIRDALRNHDDEVFALGVSAVKQLIAERDRALALLRKLREYTDDWNSLALSDEAFTARLYLLDEIDALLEEK